MIRRCDSISAAIRQDITKMKIAKMQRKGQGSECNSDLQEKFKRSEALTDGAVVVCGTFQPVNSTSLSIFGLATATWRTRRETNAC